MKSTLITVAAWILIVFGAISLFLPFLQGVVCIVIGLYLLSRGSPKAREKLRVWYAAFKIRFPRIALRLEKVEKKWQDVVYRWRHRSHKDESY